MFLSYWTTDQEGDYRSYLNCGHFSVDFIIYIPIATMTMIFNKRRTASLNKLALRNIVLVPIRAFTVSSSGKSISSKLHPWFVTGFADAESCFYRPRRPNLWNKLRGINKNLKRSLGYTIPPSQLDPSWVSGFLDAESTFVISITKREQNKTGWQVQAFFKIGLQHIRRVINIAQHSNNWRCSPMFGIQRNLHTTTKNSIVIKLQPLSVAMIYFTPEALNNDSNNKNLNPNFITGFIYAEGCF